MTEAETKRYGVFALLMVAILSVAVIAGGCSTPQGSSEKVTLNVKGNSLCSVPEQEWSVNDTPETIEKAVRFNTGRARACGSKPKVTS